jgi:hypothetical protein
MEKYFRQLLQSVSTNTPEINFSGCSLKNIKLIQLMHGGILLSFHKGS